MKVTLLGTGSPQPRADRFGAANLVQHDGTSLLIDAGSGVTQRLAALGVSGRDITAVLLTHMHSDHVIDLYQFIISSWHQGRSKPQRIIGPPGTRAFITELMACWHKERSDRIAFEQRPSTIALDIHIEELHPTEPEPITLGGLVVQPVVVDHKPIEHAYGFAISTTGEEERAVFSGDTRWCGALVEAARGCDVLVHEVFIKRAMPVSEGVRTAATVEATASYHTLSSEVGKLAAEAQVGVLLLNHFAPPVFDKDALMAEVGSDFDGPVVIGEDLMQYDIPTKTLRAQMPLAAPSQQVLVRLSPYNKPGNAHASTASNGSNGSI
ncbi:unnamed protein product [Vitrella brassicaformis CCMP3155]|uniref:Metallo-beta-lactamase domain-containing protein n=2 Tax=Vitrella brassicaformis TaxID=1169539 RepID=A0A0G4EJ11_VITBC|nr:unnamed protein product [Vitrella brassicaformis CCMP3155]|mmetsp:Transcript_44974/g.111702  ORF Transcript_44974/g.111702 Transcript_44974/m.111702 type:complete len:324 (+) Transcript_44974:235-1206(+)|eukprot:CEL97001.1 unnamed protein product [Vitrella brassicaformis CCMP3155]